MRGVGAYPPPPAGGSPRCRAPFFQKLKNRVHRKQSEHPCSVSVYGFELEQRRIEQRRRGYLENLPRVNRGVHRNGSAWTPWSKPQHRTKRGGGVPPSPWHSPLSYWAEIPPYAIFTPEAAPHAPYGRYQPQRGQTHAQQRQRLYTVIYSSFRGFLFAPVALIIAAFLATVPRAAGVSFRFRGCSVRTVLLPLERPSARFAYPPRFGA